MRNTFLNPELDAALERDGYVVLPLLDPAEVEQLAAAYENLGVAPGDPQRACIDTFHCFDDDYKEAVHGEVESVLAPKVQALFDRHKSLSYCYIQKWSDETSGFGLHQDISVLDETKYRSVEVWCALTDTNEENGELWIVPGSHKWAPVPRGIHGCPPPYVGVEERIIRRHAIPVPVKAGDAVIFCHSTYHFSFANRSGKFRLVAATDMIPEEAQHLHYVAGNNGKITTYEIEESFWVENNPFTLHKAPETAIEVGEVDPATFPRLTDADLDRLVAEGAAIEHEPIDLGQINPELRWCHRCGTTEGVEGYVDPLVGNTNLLCARCDAAQARMAGCIGDIDPALVATLDVDGWAVVPLLDDEALAAAREIASRFAPPSDRAFFASNRDATRDDAVLIDHALQELTQPAIDRVLPGYRVFKGALVVKGATGDNPVGLHQDWEYVDERYHRGFVIWCPLDDATASDGGMQVVPGSHRWLGNHRGYGLPEPYSDVAQEIIGRSSQDVPLAAGQGVVYDNALLHHTHPNEGDSPRLAIAVAIAPPKAPVIHLQATGDGTAEVFEIPPGDNHFTANEFGARPAGRPLRVVDLDMSAVTSSDLDRWIPPADDAPAAPVAATVPDIEQPVQTERRRGWRQLLRR